MANMERQEINRYCYTISSTYDFKALDFSSENIRDPNVLWDFFKRYAKLKEGEILSLCFDDENYSEGVNLILNAVRLETDQEMSKRIEREVDEENKKTLKIKKAEKELKDSRYKKYLELKKEFESE